jgi:hypothetical protein
MELSLEFHPVEESAKEKAAPAYRRPYRARCAQVFTLGGGWN